MTEVGGPVVEPAAPGDAVALAQLDRLVNPSPWTENQYSGACGASPETSERALVIRGDDHLRGFVVYSTVLDEACIHNIAVHPERRGRGLGLLLLSAALTEAARGGAARCTLEVRASNEAARRLYESQGFRLDGVRKSYYPSAVGSEDALLMSRQLATASSESAANNRISDEVNG